MEKPLYCEKCLKSYHNYLIDNINLNLDILYERRVTSRRVRSPRVRPFTPSVPNTKTKASSMCCECNQYLCVDCARDHSEHFMFTYDEIDSPANRRILLGQLMRDVENEGEQRLENFRRGTFTLYGVVDIRHWNDDSDYPDTPSMCVLRNSHRWVIAERGNKCIKVFDAHTNNMIRRIKLSSEPCGITEVPQQVSSSGSLIAVTIPDKHELLLIDLDQRPARIVHTIHVPGKCSHIFYSRGHLITFQYFSHGGPVHIINTSGEITNVIDLLTLPDISLSGGPYWCAVHEQSGIIYISSCDDKMVFSMKMTGQVINSFSRQDFYPMAICVDSSGSVYVHDNANRQIQKLSADLSQCKPFIGREQKDRIAFSIHDMIWHNDKLYINDLFHCVTIVRHV